MHLRIITALVLFWVVSPAASQAQEMQKAEEPDEVGLMRYWPDLSSNSTDSLPLEVSKRRPGLPLVTAEDLDGSSP